MKTYIFKYSARLHGRSLSGRIEATNALKAEQCLKNSNELIKNIRVSLLSNQTSARKQSFLNSGETA